MNAANKIDWAKFNCSQQYEIDYVKNLYEKPSDVEAWIIEACKPGGKVNNTSHDELYAMLKNAGFTKRS